MKWWKYGVWAVMLTVLLTMVPKKPIYAATNNNAFDYYKANGNKVIFCPTSKTDGNIYYATKAGKASTNIRFRTIGWKVTIKKKSGTRLQTIYFQLGGSYMSLVDTTTKSNDEYNLYSLSLYNLKRRMNKNAKKALQNGNATIVLDACMVVVKDGKAQGAMTDKGPSSGKVYTTKSGIEGAEKWSVSAKQSFSNYFSKQVEGLFYEVSVDADLGIKKVSGIGIYCYGTYVTLKAQVEKGYTFESWSGGVRSTEKTVSFYVTSNQNLQADTKKITLTICFHRNFDAQDSEVQTVSYSYGKKDSFPGLNWSKNETTMRGWSTSATGTKVAYKVKSAVTDSMILKKAPKLDLYAIWPSQPKPTGGDTPVIEDIPEEIDPPIVEEEQPVHYRFISQKYFEDSDGQLISDTKGGLSETSRWAVDPTLRQMLRQILNQV